MTSEREEQTIIIQDHFVAGGVNTNNRYLYALHPFFCERATTATAHDGIKQVRKGPPHPTPFATPITSTRLPDLLSRRRCRRSHRPRASLSHILHLPNVSSSHTSRTRTSSGRTQDSQPQSCADVHLLSNSSITTTPSATTTRHIPRSNRTRRTLIHRKPPRPSRATNSLPPRVGNAPKSAQAR